MTIYKLHNVLTETHDWCNLYMGLSIKEGYQKKIIDGALLSVKPIRIRKVYVFLSIVNVQLLYILGDILQCTVDVLPCIYHISSSADM